MRSWKGREQLVAVPVGVTAESFQHRVEAVHTAGDGPGEATVGTVAHQLGLDHSGAGRMVRDTVAAGYLIRAASSTSSIRWDRQDRRQLAAYLQRLAGELGASRRPPSRPCSGGGEHVVADVPGRPDDPGGVPELGEHDRQVSCRERR